MPIKANAKRAIHLFIYAGDFSTSRRIMNAAFTIVEELGERKSYNFVIICSIEDDTTAVLHQRIPCNSIMLILIGLGISYKLKTLTLNLNICLVCVIHINRQGQIRGSAGPEQVANNVVRLTRDKNEVDEWRRNVTAMTVEKCRLSGKTGPACWVYYNSMTGRLEEITDRDLINQYESGGSIAGHEFAAYDSS